MEWQQQRFEIREQRLRLEMRTVDFGGTEIEAASKVYHRQISISISIFYSSIWVENCEHIYFQPTFLFNCFLNPM